MNDGRILLLISILPVYLLGRYIYKRDINREPKKLLAKLFVGGISACFLTLFITGFIESISYIFNSDMNDLNLYELLIAVFIGVALVEEGSKWIMAYLISYRSKEFDEFYDAIVYCVFVSLGFACFENILYVFQGASVGIFAGIGVGITRGLLSIPGHACFGVLMGYSFGLAKKNDLYGDKTKKIAYLFLSILLPTIAHGIYDYCLFASNSIFTLIFFIFIVILYIYIFNKVRKLSLVSRKMKYNDNYCGVCGRKVESNFCPVCGNHNE